MIYSTPNGCYFSEQEVSTAFRIISNSNTWDGYTSWMNYMTKTKNLIPHKENKCSINEVAKTNSILAMRLYRDKMNCSLADARNYIKYILEQERENVYD